MIEGAETRLDGTTLVVRIPMRFQRRGGRKRIVAPDSSEIVPTTKAQPDGALIRALARAWRWQKMLDEGAHALVGEIADAEGISCSYVSRVLRLTLLGPDIVERIVDGRGSPGLPELMAAFPIEWEKQRADLLRGRRRENYSCQCPAPNVPDDRKFKSDPDGRSMQAQASAYRCARSGRIF